MREPTIETIRPRTRSCGRALIHLASCGSTMDEARRLAEQGAEDGTVVVADEQTQGRGRRGRTWFSPRGALLATLVVRPASPPASVSLLPLAAGLALVRSIERLTRAPARLKWPNDVWIDGRKVAGVLVETRIVGERVEWALVGLGVNVDVKREDLPSDVRDIATSLSMWRGGHVCGPALLKIWLEQFESLYQEIEAGRGNRIVSEAESRLVGLGEEVRVHTGEGVVSGVALRLGASGELVVRADGGERAFREGDCELVRPLAPS